MTRIPGISRGRTFQLRNAALFVSLLASGLALGADGQKVFNIRDYGARGGDGANQQRAIQAAIDRCAAAGGGIVLIPPEVYVSGPLRLGSRVTLYLEAGATLCASTNQSDYAGSSGAAFLSAQEAQGIAIRGPGVINGQARADFGSRWGVPEKPPFRTRILQFTQCRDVTVRDVTILNSDSWTLHFKRCEDINIQSVTIRNNCRRLNSDGIDPDSCRNVRISDCRITAGDDCIVLKATEPYPCENITVSNCVLESASSALKLGTESFGDFRHIRFLDCVISNSPTGIGLYLKDGGTVENVVCSNIFIGPCAPTYRVVTPVFIDIERRHADSKVGQIRNATFERLDIASGSGILAQGIPESLLEDVVFRQVRLRVSEAHDYSQRKKPSGGRTTTTDGRETCFARLPSYFTVAYARNLQVEDVKVEISPAAFAQYDRSAFAGRHLEGGKILRVRRSPAQAAAGVPVLDLEDCPLLIRE